jgi:hypothetical protein
MPPVKRKPTPLARLGTFLLVVGMALAGVFAICVIDESTDFRFSGVLLIGSLLLALTGLLFIVHTLRRTPESPICTDSQY